MRDRDPLEDLELEIQKELRNSNREDGSGGDSNAVSAANQARMGVLLRMLSTIKDEQDYRQLVLLADFLDDEEADRVAAAITEARRYGLSLDPILDWVTARCAVNKLGHGKSRVAIAVEGLTHSTFTSYRRDQGKRGFLGKGNDNKEAE